MAAELMTEGLGLAARAIGRMLVWLACELFVDVLLESTGRVLLTRLRIVDEPGEGLCVLVGLAVWLLVFLAAGRALW